MTDSKDAGGVSLLALADALDHLHRNTKGRYLCGLTGAERDAIIYALRRSAPVPQRDAGEDDWTGLMADGEPISSHAKPVAWEPEMNNARAFIAAHTIDSVPSCGQENDYRNATPPARSGNSRPDVREPRELIDREPDHGQYAPPPPSGAREALKAILIEEGPRFYLADRWLGILPRDMWMDEFVGLIFHVLASLSTDEASR